MGRFCLRLWLVLGWHSGIARPWESIIEFAIIRPLFVYAIIRSGSMALTARPHYKRWVCVRPSVRLRPPDDHVRSGKQRSCTSSLLQLGNGSLRDDTSYDIANTPNSQWSHMFSHVLPPSNSRQVRKPHPTMPVHRQNQSPNHPTNDDAKTLCLPRPSSAFGSVQRSTPNLDVGPDDALNEPIVDVSLCEDHLPSVDQEYFAANTPPSSDTHEYSTYFPLRPAQFSSDSLAITLETTSVSPHQQSPSPGSHTVASHLSLPVSPSSPERLANVFTVNSQQLRNVAIESEMSPEAPSSVETTNPASSTTRQDRTADITLAEVPNFCHLCRVSFTQPQVFHRHLKDKHEDKESCTRCSSFKWSRGRPYLYRRHLRLKHPEVTSSEDRPPRTRTLRTVGARQRNIPNGKTEATSGSLCPHMTVLLGPSIPPSR